MGFLMASPMQAEDIEWGNPPPCQIELLPPLIFENPAWHNEPQPALAIRVGECLYIVEYYTASALYNGRYAFYIAGIYESTIGNPNPCDASREELYQAAMVEIIKKEINSFIGDPNEGEIVHFYVGSCVVDFNFPDLPIEDKPIELYLMFNKQANLVLDLSSLESPDPNMPYITFEEIQEVCIGDINSGNWRMPIKGGFRSCQGSPCCMATYWVTRDEQNNEVKSMNRIGEIVYEPSGQCVQFMSYGYCIPNCDALFESYGYTIEHYDMFIFPNPVDAHINLVIPGLPADEYEIHLMNSSGATIFIFTMALDELSTLDLTQFSLDPGTWQIVIYKNGKPISWQIFMKN